MLSQIRVKYKTSILDDFVGMFESLSLEEKTIAIYDLCIILLLFLNNLTTVIPIICDTHIDLLTVVIFC